MINVLDAFRYVGGLKIRAINSRITNGVDPLAYMRPACDNGYAVFYKGKLIGVDDERPDYTKLDIKQNKDGTIAVVGYKGTRMRASDAVDKQELVSKLFPIIKKKIQTEEGGQQLFVESPEDIKNMVVHYDTEKLGERRHHYKFKGLPSQLNKDITYIKIMGNNRGVKIPFFGVNVLGTFDVRHYKNPLPDIWAKLKYSISEYLGLRAIQATADDPAARQDMVTRHVTNAYTGGEKGIAARQERISQRQKSALAYGY